MRVLQVLDHVGIYLVIAGSMTPFMLVALHHHTAARVLICGEWIAAFLGSVFAGNNNEFSVFIMCTRVRKCAVCLLFACSWLPALFCYNALERSVLSYYLLSTFSHLSSSLLGLE